MKPTILIALLVVVFSSCSHKTQPGPLTGDYLIIGWTGGFAGNIFITDYMLINSTQCIKSSNTGGVPTDNSKFLFTKVQSQAKFDSVKYLLHSIPSDLIAMGDAAFGLACCDMGALDVRASIGGKQYYWAFGPDTFSASNAIKQFAVEVGNAYY